MRLHWVDIEREVEREEQRTCDDKVADENRAILYRTKGVEFGATETQFLSKIYCKSLKVTKKILIKK